jgi:ribonuclease G
MSSELVIEATPFGLRAGLLEGGRLLEVSLLDGGAISVRGQIWLGRVRTVDPDLDAAFVDCGMGQDCWLAARDAPLEPGQARGTPIGQRVHEGQALIVQGRRDPQGGKGARLRTDVALVGPCLVYRPQRPGNGLAERPAARDATAAELGAEATRLHALWQAVLARAHEVSAPALLHGPADPVQWLLAEHLGAGPGRILVADPVSLARARRWLSEWRPGRLNCLEHVPDAFAASGAEEQLIAALEPVVPLERGGQLTIEPTAALTAIDVDGGGRRPLEVDLEAAGEIARQLRLRQLGGTIVVDFVDLISKRDRACLFSAVRTALAADPVPAQAFAMSALGLVEISRRRVGPSLAEQFGRICPSCEGRGRVPSLRAQSEALMRALAARPPARLQAALAPDLYGYLGGRAATVWAAFGERLGWVPALRVDAGLASGAWAIEEAGDERRSSPAG